MSRITPNCRVRVKLTEHGKLTILSKIDAFNDYMRVTKPNVSFRRSMPDIDACGCIEVLLWELMRDLDGASTIGGHIPFEWMEKKL